MRRDIWEHCENSELVSYWEDCTTDRGRDHMAYCRNDHLGCEGHFDQRAIGLRRIVVDELLGLDSILRPVRNP